jgi:hypothetical protein
VPEFDEHDINEGIVPQQPYNKQSEQLRWLLDTIKDSDERDRFNFLRFVAGAPCLPSGGFKGLKFKCVSQLISVQMRLYDHDQPMGDAHHPYAATCFSHPKIAFERFPVCTQSLTLAMHGCHFAARSAAR